MRPYKLLAITLIASALPALSSCAADDEGVIGPAVPEVGGEIFARYAALGNSITAGIQSAGISDSTQRLSYPNLVAGQAGAPFQLPLFADPGCPPPWLAPLGIGGRVGGPNAPACALRQTISRPIQNLAVPGAQITDAVDQFANTDAASSFNRIQTLILGGRSQLQAAQQLQPTLASIWLGNGDVLGAALSGNAQLLTPEARFRESLNTLVSGLRAISTLQDAVVIGVVNTNSIPLLQWGAYYWLTATVDPATQARTFQGKRVNPNCAPAPNNPQAFHLVSFEILGNANFTEINCAEDAYPAGDPRRGVFVLTAAEQAAITARTAAFNAMLQQAAQANGWSYIDPNALLATLGNERDAQGRYQNLRKCQALPAALQTGSPLAIQAAIVTSCPVPPTGITASFAAPNFFGALISFDGFHPATLAHRHVANAIITVLNAKHSLSIPAVPLS